MTSKDLCPRCNRLGAVVDQDSILGYIYECFHCKEDLPFGQGEVIRDRSITWACPPPGGKMEVIG